ncbi:MAG: ankyrin repeat domain-containing protein, partial [Epsilonproteobacteria bacterium]|nr:ankyrin repeat domain-containing protein [Campylobacterota bacterium]
MRKFVVLLVLVGLFSSCSMKATESEEQLNLLKDLKEVYYEDNRKGEIKLLGNLYVNLDDFFQLSEKEQIQKAQELEKELKLEQQRWFSERGIDYDLNDSDDEKSRKIKKQSLQQSLPSEALNQIEEAEKIDNNEYIQKIKELMFYVIPDDEKLKYRLKENRMLLMKYSPILSPDEHEKLFEDSYGNGTMTVDKKLKSGGEMIDEDIKTIQKDVMGFKNKSTNLVMNKSFDEIEKISDNNIIEIKKIIQKKDYKINHLTSSYMEHTVLYNAIQKGNLKLVKVLVENGADLNIKDRNNHTPIYYASQFAYKHIVDYLIEQQNIDLSIGEPLIGSIVNYNDFQLIDKCLEKGLKIDSKNSFGNTPLILAIYNDAKLKTIRYLVSKGADIYALTEENKNILEVAEKANKKKVYDYLKTIYKSEENEKFVNSEDKVLNTINKQHKFSIEHLFVTKDEKRFITVDAKDTIRVFDLNKGILLKKFTVDAERGIVDVKLFNNKLLASSSYDVRLIDLNNIHNITIFRETIEKNKIMHKKSYINSVDISPNGKQIVISRG